MNRWFINLILIPLIVSSNTCYSIEECPQRIQITYLNFYMTTVENIHCKNFTDFSKLSKNVSINNNLELKEFAKKTHFKKVKYRDIDARIKVTFFYKDNIESFCISKFGDFYSIDTDNLYSNTDLFELILNYLPIPYRNFYMKSVK